MRHPLFLARRSIKSSDRTEGQAGNYCMPLGECLRREHLVKIFATCHCEQLGSMSSLSRETLDLSHEDRDVHIYVSNSILAQRLLSLAQIQSRPGRMRVGGIARTRSTMRWVLAEQEENLWRGY